MQGPPSLTESGRDKELSEPLTGCRLSMSKATSRGRCGWYQGADSISVASIAYNTACSDGGTSPLAEPSEDDDTPAMVVAGEPSGGPAGVGTSRRRLPVGVLPGCGLATPPVVEALEPMLCRCEAGELQHSGVAWS